MIPSAWKIGLIFKNRKDFVTDILENVHIFGVTTNQPTTKIRRTKDIDRFIKEVAIFNNIRSFPSNQL